MGKPIGDIAGQTFGKLKAVAVTVRGGGSVKWLCECTCGNLAEVTAARLASGHTKSCGCLLRDPVVARPVPGTTKCRTRLREYNVWRGMKQRCYNENCPEYRYYGGRGIQICERWLTFENFYEDMGPRPGDGYEIDRIDNDGWYSPSNCHWIPGAMQARNTSATNRYTFAGVKMSASDWADFFGVTKGSITQAVSGLGLQTAFNRLVVDKCVYYNGDLDVEGVLSDRKERYFSISGSTYCSPKVATYFGVGRRQFRAMVRRNGAEYAVRHYEVKTGKFLKDYVQ